MLFTVLKLKHWPLSQRWAAAVAVGGAAMLSGCVVAPAGDGYTDYELASTTIYTSYGNPPPARIEYRTVAPAPDYVWMAGHWFWTGGRYDWRPGRWAAPGYRPFPPHHPPRRVGPPHRPHMPPPKPAPRPPQSEAPSRPPHMKPHRPHPPKGSEFGAPQRPPQVRPHQPQQDRGERHGPPRRSDRDGKDHRRP